MKKYLTHALVVAMIGIGIVIWLWYSKTSLSSGEDLVPTSIIGVQHLGYGYLISDFYVDKYGGGTIPRTGGGGSMVCCVILPPKWRPGLTVEIRWRVEDWTRENRAQIDAGNYASVTEKGIYLAQVPVEKYEEPHDVYVHFFSRGRVRVVSTMYSVLNPLHPVPYGLVHSDSMATAGWPIKEMFSQAELQEMKKRSNPWK